MDKKEKKVETYSYKGWLNSDSFLKRSFSVFGYNAVAVLIIYGTIFGLVILFGLAAVLLEFVGK